MHFLLGGVFLCRLRKPPHCSVVSQRKSLWIFPKAFLLVIDFAVVIVCQDSFCNNHVYTIIAVCPDCLQNYFLKIATKSANFFFLITNPKNGESAACGNNHTANYNAGNCSTGKSGFGQLLLQNKLASRAMNVVFSVASSAPGVCSSKPSFAPAVRQNRDKIFNGKII